MANFPLNEEHAEANQADINSKRAEAVSKMSPSEQEKMSVIESVSAQLEKAEIPFFLFASPIENETPKNRHQFWQFNKLSYAKDYKKKCSEYAKRMFYDLAPVCFRYIFCSAVEYVSTFDKEREFMYGWSQKDGRLVISEKFADGMKNDLEKLGEDEVL